MISNTDRKSQLLRRRAELVDRIDEVEDELDSHETKDWDDLAAEREGDEVLEQQGLHASAEIAKIDAALERISSGEYGYCVKCGAKISEERLDLLPWTPFCRSCAV